MKFIHNKAKVWYEDLELVEIINALAIDSEFVDKVWWLSSHDIAVKFDDGHISKFKIHRNVSKQLA